MLDIQQIAKTFHAGTPNEVRALRGVDLKIEPGSFVILIGTNGSGKSTLLNAVAGSFLVDTGRLKLNGREITRWPEHRRAQFIGRVFQIMARAGQIPPPPFAELDGLRLQPEYVSPMQALQAA